VIDFSYFDSVYRPFIYQSVKALSLLYCIAAVKDETDLEDSLVRRHQSSFSTLGHTSSVRSTDGAQEMELQQTGSQHRLAASAAADASNATKVLVLKAMSRY